MGKRPLGIYVHIPFCVRKCAYCDFVSFPLNASSPDSLTYIDAVLSEIRGYKEKYRCEDTEYEVKTVYIGGGTPSVLAPSYIVWILACIRENLMVDDGAEITIEVNPGTVDEEKLRTYRTAGINRLSIGLQSANDNELKELGRIHDFADFMSTYTWAVKAGFDNISVDIMTAIPLQTPESLKNTLDVVTGLIPAPKHISAYSLILEEGTPFYEKYAGCDSLPCADEMYHLTVDHLREKGYERYEISNFSKEGYSSRHNTAYWKRRDYIGFGLAASSLVNGIRYKNTTVLADYSGAPLGRELFEEEIKLSREDEMSEFMFLGLRMSEGVRESEFERKFQVTIKDVYGTETERLVKEGLLIYDKDTGRYYLSDTGVDYGNYVFSRFV
ncbi:MAG: radical SAM family heme chaperone HemW [Lachnospiraceae bacterium]|nr:radical SAM family heme chaperone HemW [Lachnospiraceae bacterium]